MSRIHDAIKELHQLPGVKGAALLTTDGMVAAESLDEGLRSDVVAGLTSYLLMTTTRSLEEGGQGKLSQFVLHATHGKVILSIMEDSCLVVLFDQFADPNHAKREVQEAAHRIRRASRMA